MLVSTSFLASSFSTPSLHHTISSLLCQSGLPAWCALLINTRSRRSRMSLTSLIAFLCYLTTAPANTARILGRRELETQADKISQDLDEFDTLSTSRFSLPASHLCELVSISVDLHELGSPCCLFMLYFSQSRRSGSTSHLHLPLSTIHLLPATLHYPFHSFFAPWPHPHPIYSCVHRRRLSWLLLPHPRPTLATRPPPLLPAPESRRLLESPEPLPSLSTSSQLLSVAPLLSTLLTKMTPSRARFANNKQISIS